MKTLPLFLVLSLLGNAALGYVLWRPATPSTVPTRNAAAPTSAGATASRSINTAQNDRDHAARGSASAPSLWSRLYSDDLEVLAARLKEAGFSNREISAVIVPRIFEKFAPGLAEGQRPYWQSDRPDYSDPAVQEAMRRNATEQQRLISKFVGFTDLANDPDALGYARRRFGNLSLEKLQALQQLEADYQQLAFKASLENRARPGEVPSGDLRAAHKLIEQEKMADIAKLLTPEELAQYELRGGEIAQQLRFRLRAFQPTEQEYLAIYAVQKKYAAQLNDPAQRASAMGDVSREIAAALGSERAEDYAATLDSPNDQTTSLVQRLGLPARVAPQIRTLQKDFTAQAATIRANPQLSAADRAAQLSALAQQARAALTAKLGAAGFEAYDDRKGEWIRALEKPAPSRP